MRTVDVVRAWGRILAGRIPSMSIEITRRCPLSCPGCYAYGDLHLGEGGTRSRLHEYKGEELIREVLSVVDDRRPLHLSIVGGEPLLRHQEITQLLPALGKRGIHTQIVTSAFRPIPPEWNRMRLLNVVVSIDGLQPEHDKRRAPATYERILENIRGRVITVHCTVTGQMTQQPGYLRDFLDFWTKQPEVRKVWMSLYTPQRGEASAERLVPDARMRVLDELSALSKVFPKLELPEPLLRAYREPPSAPHRCIFALTTETVSSDLKTKVEPCQLGGKPDCRQCGCIAAAVMEAVNQHRLPFGIRVGAIYVGSRSLGRRLRAWRDADFRLSLRQSQEPGQDPEPSASPSAYSDRDATPASVEDPA